MTKEAVIQEMFKNVVHVGHRTHKWNPMMRKYLFGESAGMHIIDLEKACEFFERALQYLNKLVSEGKVILFASTKPQSLGFLEETAKAANMPYVISKWIPGLLTNFDTIKTRIRYLTDLKMQESSGELEKYTKKEIAGFKKDIEKLQIALGGVENMKGLPDALFVVDIVRDSLIVDEATKLGIPVMAIVDTNGDPTKVAYPILGNDDSVDSLKFFFGKIAETLKKAKA